MKFDIPFILLNISAVLTLVLLVILLRMRNKTQLHYSFIGVIATLCLWTWGYVIELYLLAANIQIEIISYIDNIGTIFAPITILLMGLIYAKTNIRFNLPIKLLFVFPVIDFVMFLTNGYHHRYFIAYSVYNDKVIYGDFFLVHTIVSYAYILTGLAFLVYSSIRNSGLFSMQSNLVLIGALIPLTVNVLLTFRVLVLPVYATPVSFTFAVLFSTIAIFRFQFLKISPIALRTVVDKISDSFLVVNSSNQIIDYNKNMKDSFDGLIQFSHESDVSAVFQDTCLMEGEHNLVDLIDMAKVSATSVVFESHIQKDNFDKYFSIEITPIISKRNYLGTIILFRDITENIKHLEDMEEKHKILMEQERLASLGQLIGGIAHNLKTPIMSISGAVEALKDLVSEYEQSIGDATVSDEDHREVAGEMRTWLSKTQPYCSYMTDIIDTVKGQTMSLSNAMMIGFTIPELVKRIELLLKYELTRYNCTLNTEIKVNPSTELYGDINSLVQVFDNIIINAIQAYEGKQGRIDFLIEENDENVLFTVRDYAKGIPEKVKDKLLKEMVTTKGTAGTGLGLYMSGSTIKARFQGKMWFESWAGQGTAFYILIPKKK